MKRFCKIVAIGLVIIMSFSSTIMTYARELTTDDKVNYLVYQGFPIEFFENKENSEIENIYSTLYGQDIRYMGSETVIMSELRDNFGVSPLGIIPSEDMKLTITKVSSVTYDSSKKLDKIKEVYIYMWIMFGHLENLFGSGMMVLQ